MWHFFGYFCLLLSGNSLISCYFRFHLKNWAFLREVSALGQAQRVLLSLFLTLVSALENFFLTYSDQAWPFSTCQKINVAGLDCLGLRVSFVGEMGWELHVAKEHCLPLYKALMEAGRPVGLVNAGYRAIDALSIEKGYPHWHAEIRMDDNPFQAGLAWTCKLKADIDFQGRQALQALKAQGSPNRKKVCFTLNDK